MATFGYLVDALETALAGSSIAIRSRHLDNVVFDVVSDAEFERAGRDRRVVSVFSDHDARRRWVTVGYDSRRYFQRAGVWPVEEIATAIKTAASAIRSEVLARLALNQSFDAFSALHAGAGAPASHWVVNDARAAWVEVEFDGTLAGLDAVNLSGLVGDERAQVVFLSEGYSGRPVLKFVTPEVYRKVLGGAQ